jgi:hypothetical protein
VQTKQLVIWLAVVLITGCGSREKKQAGEEAAETGVSSTVPNPARTPYVIPQAGIRLKPPASWDANLVRVVSRTGSDAAAIQPGADFSIAFDYKAEQPAHQDHALLDLHVLRRAAWEQVASGSQGAVIDSIGDWVYVAVVPSTNPYRAGLLDADQFELMRLTLADVRELFSIQDGGPAEGALQAESNGR